MVFGVGNIHGLVLIDCDAEGTVEIASVGGDREESDEARDLRHLANEVVRGVGDVQISAERRSDPRRCIEIRRTTDGERRHELSTGVENAHLMILRVGDVNVSVERRHGHAARSIEKRKLPFGRSGYARRARERSDRATHDLAHDVVAFIRDVDLVLRRERETVRRAKVRRAGVRHDVARRDRNRREVSMLGILRRTVVECRLHPPFRLPRLRDQRRIRFIGDEHRCGRGAFDSSEDRVALRAVDR